MSNFVTTPYSPSPPFSSAGSTYHVQCNTHPRRPRGSQSEAGEMARRNFSRTGGRTPGYQVSPDHFQTALRIPAPDWAEKIPCIILPNRRPATLESLSCVLHGDCCPATFIWLVHQNNARRAGKFQFDNPVHFKMLFTQKTNKSKGK